VQAEAAPDRVEKPADEPPPQTDAVAGAPAPEAVKPPVEQKPALTMDDVAALTPDSDFSAFVARGVDENVKRSAMKKLFSDPHFNVMDGLDIYIEDYNKFEPIPPEMLALLNHAKNLLDPLAHLEKTHMRLLDHAEAESSMEKHAQDTAEAAEADVQPEVQPNMQPAQAVSAEADAAADTRQPPGEPHPGAAGKDDPTDTEEARS
jgi:hypothetical protein